MLDDFRKCHKPGHGVKSFSHIKVSLVAMLQKVKVFSGIIFTVECTHLPLTGGGAGKGKVCTSSICLYFRLHYLGSTS